MESVEVPEEGIVSIPCSPPPVNLPVLVAHRSRSGFGMHEPANQLTSLPYVPLRRSHIGRVSGQRPALVSVGGQSAHHFDGSAPSKRSRASRVQAPEFPEATIVAQQPQPSKPPMSTAKGGSKATSISPVLIDELRCILGDGVSDSHLVSLLRNSEGSVNIAANRHLDGSASTRPVQSPLPATPKPPSKPSAPPKPPQKAQQRQQPTKPLQPLPRSSPVVDSGAGVFTPLTRSLFTPTRIPPSPATTNSPLPSPLDEPELESTSTWIPPELLSHLASEHLSSGVSSSSAGTTVRTSLSASLLSGTSGSIERVSRKSSGARSRSSVTR